MATNSFFEKSQKQQPANVNFALRINDNSCFLPLAAALLDAMFSNKTILKKELSARMSSLLTQYHSYFPGEFTNIAFKTVEDRLRFMVKKYSIEYFLYQLAFVIRQITMDELCSHLDDPAAFSMLSKNDIAYLRNPATALDVSIIYWVANILEISVRVESVNSFSDMPHVRTYNAKATTLFKLILVIGESAGCFYPKIEDKSLFDNYHHLSWLYRIWPINTRLDSNKLQDKIEINIRNMVHSTATHYKRLSLMFADGDLNLTKLQTLRSKFQIQAQDISLQPYLIRYASELVEQMSVDANSPRGLEYSIINNFAIELGFGLISADDFYAQMDVAESPTSRFSY